VIAIRRCVALLFASAIACSNGANGSTESASENVPRCPSDDAATPATVDPNAMLSEGQKTFRYETFGNEAFWGDSLQLHRAIEGEKHGGVGAGLTPRRAISFGLKVDVDALPIILVSGVKKHAVNLDDVGTMLALLRNDAVIGVKGTFGTDGNLASVGIRCALCHSTVDDGFTYGIGHRLDGFANRDLDFGGLVNLAPDLTAFAANLGFDDATLRKTFAAWGKGRFDAALLLDGQGFRADGSTTATLVPPTFGLAGVEGSGYTGFGSVAYTSAFFAVVQMHGQGTFLDSRLDDAEHFPIAARTGVGHVRFPLQDDRVTPKLPALHAYLLSLSAPRPPATSFDPDAAARGSELFAGTARCARCHVPPTFTEPGFDLHSAGEIGIDEFHANRSPTRRYRTTPLRGLWTHEKGGFYHDGRYASLLDVVNHYDQTFSLGLSDAQKKDLVQYLESL